MSAIKVTVELVDGFRFPDGGMDYVATVDDGETSVRFTLDEDFVFLQSPANDILDKVVQLGGRDVDDLKQARANGAPVYLNGDLVDSAAPQPSRF